MALIKMKDYNTNANREILIKHFKQTMHIAEAIKRTNEFFDKPSSFKVEEFKSLLALLEPKKISGKKPKNKT